MRRRICELRELERIMGMLEGEMKYRKNPLRQSFLNISVRSSGIYGKWLSYVAGLMENSNFADGERMDENGGSSCQTGGFMSVWNQGLRWLGMQGDRICIRAEDIEGLKYMGQALTETGIDSQINALLLEKTVLHNQITELSNELKNKSRIAFSMCGLGGLLVVICLAV